MTSTPEPSAFGVENGDNDAPQEDDTQQHEGDTPEERDGQQEGDTQLEGDEGDEGDTPQEGVRKKRKKIDDDPPHIKIKEHEVDELPQELKIRVLKRYTNLSNNDIFRRTGTASRTGRRMLSKLPPRPTKGKGRTGRPPRVSHDTVQKMIAHVSGQNSDRVVGWEDLGKEYGFDAHKHTIQRAMERAGYKKCHACQKGYLTPENREQRLQFAKDYQLCPRWQWDQVIFSDEIHVQLHYRKKQKKEWDICEDNERFCIDCIPQKHHKGKAEFHIWTSIAWNYKGPLVFYEGSGDEAALTEEFYRDWILRAHVEPRHRVFRANGKGFVLQENNDGLHRTRSLGDPAWRFKDEVGMHYYANPPNSFDFNPTVSVWRLVKERLKLPKASTKEELQWEIQVEWDKITIEEINTEITSMQGRIDQCVERDGLQTRS